MNYLQNRPRLRVSVMLLNPNTEYQRLVHDSRLTAHDWRITSLSFFPAENRRIQ